MISQNSTMFQKVLQSIFLVMCLLFAVSMTAQNQKFDSIDNLLKNQMNVSQTVTTEHLINELYQIARQSPDSIRLVSHCLYREAEFFCIQGKSNPELLNRIKHQLTLLQKSDFLLEKVRLQQAFERCQMDMNDYSSVFNLAMKNLEALNDSVGILPPIALDLLASFASNPKFQQLNNDKKQQQLRKADFENYQERIFRSFANVSEENVSTLLDSLQNMMGIFQQFLIEEQQSAIYALFAMAYSEDNQADKADYYFRESQELAKNADNKNMQGNLYNYLGFFSEQQQDYEKALEYFTLMRKQFEESDDFTRLYAAYSNLASTFERLGHHDSALFYLKKANVLSPQIIQNNQMAEAQQKYATVFLEAAQNKLTISEQQAKLKNRLLIIIVMGMLALILLALFLYQQKRRKEAENRELSEKLKVKQIEEEKCLLEQRQQQDMIAAKEREIVSCSILLSNKNAVLQHISLLNDRIINHQEDCEKFAYDIKKTLRDSFNMEAEWKNFKLHFEQVHPDFFEKLKKLSPDMTEENLKMCAYARIGLTAKQTARILNVTVKAINMSRYRIKKKLGLQEEMNLDDFIRSI